MRHFLKLSVLTGLVVGCSTSSVLKVDSTPPGATVFIKQVGSSERQQVGKTPFASDSISTLLKTKVTGPITVEIEKEEFIPSTIIITDAGNANIDINQKLNPLPKVNDADKATGNLQDSIALNKNLEQVFEAQRLVRVGRTDEAMDLLEKVNNNYPQLASIHEMKGGIYYLQKSYAQAQDEYKKVISMIPENVIAQQMLKKIELQIAKNSTAGQAGGPPAPTDQPVKQAPEAKQ